MVTSTLDDLASLKELEAHGDSKHVAGHGYFDYEHLERLGLVRIGALMGRKFHCAITETGRAAIQRDRSIQGNRALEHLATTSVRRVPGGRLDLDPIWRWAAIG